MRFAVRVLGLDLLELEVTTDDSIPSDDPARDLSGGTSSSYPIGFAPSAGTQRWEPGEGDLT